MRSQRPINRLSRENLAYTTRGIERATIGFRSVVPMMIIPTEQILIWFVKLHSLLQRIDGDGEQERHDPQGFLIHFLSSQ